MFPNNWYYQLGGLFLSFSILAILIGMGWYLIEVLICIFLVTSDFEHLYTCSLANCMSGLAMCLLKYFAHLKKKVPPVFR